MGEEAPGDSRSGSSFWAGSSWLFGSGAELAEPGAEPSWESGGRSGLVKRPKETPDLPGPGRRGPGRVWVRRAPWGFWSTRPSPGFCNNCHNMEPYYESWLKSSHNMVPCIECHYAPGIKAEAMGKVQAANQVVKYLTRTLRGKALGRDRGCRLHPGRVATWSNGWAWYPIGGSASITPSTWGSCGGVRTFAAPPATPRSSRVSTSP